MATKSAGRDAARAPRTEDMMIAEDLKAAGFEVRMDLNGHALVSLTNRRITLMEVETALSEAGYEPCQYRAKHTADVSSVVVAAQVA